MPGPTSEMGEEKGPVDAERSETTFVVSEDTPDGIAKIISAKEKLSSIKKSLEAVFVAMQSHQSMLNRASKVWGELATWQKIIGGITLFGSVISIGIVIHVIAMVIVGALLAIGYAAASFLLDEHYETNQRAKDGLKDGIESLADLLETTILALDVIREQLAIEIANFKQENKTFADSVGRLGKENTSLGEQVGQLSTTKNELIETKDKLEKVTTLFDKLKKEFEEKIGELAGVKSSMSLEIEKLTLVRELLTTSVENFAKMVTEDEPTRNEFMKTMLAFFRDGSAAFDKGAIQFSETAKELAITKNLLANSVKDYADLFAQYQTELARVRDVLDKQRAPAEMGLFPPVKQVMMSTEGGASFEPLGMQV